MSKIPTYFIGVHSRETPDSTDQDSYFGYSLFRDPEFPLEQSPAERSILVATFDSHAEMRLFEKAVLLQ